MDRFSRLCLACAFLSLALLSFDVFPWFRDPVLPHRPTYPLGIAGAVLFILSGQWRGRMREHRLLLGGILGMAALAALATARGLQSPGMLHRTSGRASCSGRRSLWRSGSGGP